MRLKFLRRIVAALALTLTSLWSFQKDFREYPAMEYTDFPLPLDYKQPAEFVFARMMYPNAPGRFGGFGRFGDWHKGYTNWTNDYPRADRHLLLAFRRLTRIDSRSVEQPVNLEDGDDVYNWPFLYAARAGSMWLTDEMIVKLRDYLDRGGFLILDDMWGDEEYEVCIQNVQRLFPGKTVTEVDDKDPVFHTVYDLENRYQISGEWSLHSGVPYLNGGVVPHWQGIWDDHNGRMRMAVWVNNDTGDSWEWADEPRYPERYSALGIRLAVNHVTYAMTH